MYLIVQLRSGIACKTINKVFVFLLLNWRDTELNHQTKLIKTKPFFLLPESERYKTEFSKESKKAVFFKSERHTTDSHYLGFFFPKRENKC